MARIDAKVPEGVAALLEASGEDGMFRGKSDAARTAIRAYFDRNPDQAMAAVRALVTADDETELTLAEAVRIAGRPASEFPDEIRRVLRTNAEETHGGEDDEA